MKYNVRIVTNIVVKTKQVNVLLLIVNIRNFVSGTAERSYICMIIYLNDLSIVWFLYA